VAKEKPANKALEPSAKKRRKRRRPSLPDAFDTKMQHM
jgi:hypothetical protein